MERREHQPEMNSQAEKDQDILGLNDYLRVVPNTPESQKKKPEYIISPETMDFFDEKEDIYKALEACCDYAVVSDDLGSFHLYFNLLVDVENDILDVYDTIYRDAESEKKEPPKIGFLFRLYLQEKVLNQDDPFIKRKSRQEKDIIYIFQNQKDQLAHNTESLKVGEVYLGKINNKSDLLPAVRNRWVELVTRHGLESADTINHNFRFSSFAYGILTAAIHNHDLQTAVEAQKFARSISEPDEETSFLVSDALEHAGEKFQKEYHEAFLKSRQK